MESLDADYSHADNANNFSDGSLYHQPMSMDDHYISNNREYDSESNDHHSPGSRSKGSILSKMVHRSMDDSAVSDLRMSRLAQAEAAMRQEIFKECTFRPQIKGDTMCTWWQLTSIMNDRLSNRSACIIWIPQKGRRYPIHRSGRQVAE